MLDFGDELTLDGFRIPWLIWIQLLVFLLLLALLFCLSVIALDPSHHTTSPSASATATDSDLHTQQPSNHHSTAVTNRLQSTRVHPISLSLIFLLPFWIVMLPNI